MKKLIVLILVVSLLVGCIEGIDIKERQYSATFLELFDTVTTITGYAQSEEEFRAKAEVFRDELEYYHKLFNIYEEYDGMNNLKTVNDKAAVTPVTTDTAILDLLKYAIDYYSRTYGRFNPAMGSVLTIWHAAREDAYDNPDKAYIPDWEKLREESLHMNPYDIILNYENSTVFLSDPYLKIDVGAIAKGWSLQKVCLKSPGGLAVSVGGNVCVTGQKREPDIPWAVGIINPHNTKEYIHTLNIKKGSVVTSGSYMRAYVVDGRPYHHIIDPDTLYPGELWSSVTVVCDDSALADVLSTSLFLLDAKSGGELLEKYDAEALWVDLMGNRYYSRGFRELIKI